MPFGKGRNVARRGVYGPQARSGIIENDEFKPNLVIEKHYGHLVRNDAEEALTSIAI